MHEGLRSGQLVFNAFAACYPEGEFLVPVAGAVAPVHIHNNRHFKTVSRIFLRDIRPESKGILILIRIGRHFLVPYIIDIQLL